MWLTIERIFNMFTGLFVGVWIARYLGPKDFGLYSYMISFASLFFVLSSLGLDGIVIRELVKFSDKRDKILGTSFILKLTSSVLVLPILFLATKFTDNSLHVVMLILVIAASKIFQSFNVIDFYFQSKVLSRYIVFANITSLSIVNIMKIILIVSHSSLKSFVYLFIAEGIIVATSYIYVYSHKVSSVRNWSFDKNIAISLLRDCWPLILSSFIITVYMKTDQIMLKEMLGDVSVGYYSAAVKLSLPWYFIPGVIVGTLYPSIIKAKEISKEKYDDIMTKIYASMIWVAVFISVFTSFFYKDIVNLVYTSAYLASGKVLVIHIWASVFVYIGIVSSKWYITENLQIYSFYRTLAGAIINIILNYFWIPKYGIQGAAYATLFSQFVASYVFNILNYKTRGQFYIQTKSFIYPLLLIYKKFTTKKN